MKNVDGKRLLVEMKGWHELQKYFVLGELFSSPQLLSVLKSVDLETGTDRGWENAFVSRHFPWHSLYPALNPHCQPLSATCVPDIVYAFDDFSQ